jgi:hypothetical protein
MKTYLYVFSIIAMMIAISGTFISLNYASRASIAQAPAAQPNAATTAKNRQHARLSDEIRMASFAIALLGICSGFASIWLRRKEKTSNFWFIALLIIFTLASLIMV